MTAAKQRLSKYLLRNSYVWDETSIRGQRKGAWTRSHWAWIMAVRMAEPAAQETLGYYIDRCRRAIEDKQELEAEVRAHSEEPRWKPAVDALCCLRGIDAVTAFALAAETDGFSRFRSAPAYASWLGIVPSEHSSGDSRHRGGIARSGNKRVRELLIEASWHCIGASRHEKALGKDQEVAPEVRRHAARGVKRLVDRRAALLGAGKKPVVANCATARELACWAWAIGRMVEAAQGAWQDTDSVRPCRRRVRSRWDPFARLFRAALPAAPTTSKDCIMIRGNQPQRRSAPALRRHGRILNRKTGVEQTRDPCGGQQVKTMARTEGVGFRTWPNLAS